VEVGQVVDSRSSGSGAQHTDPVCLIFPQTPVGHWRQKVSNIKVSLLFIQNFCPIQFCLRRIISESHPKRGQKCVFLCYISRHLNRTVGSMWGWLSYEKQRIYKQEVMPFLGYSPVTFCKYSTSKIKAVPLQAKQVERGGRCIVPPVIDPGPRRLVSATLWPLYSRGRDKAPSVQDSEWASRPIETRITCLPNQVARFKAMNYQ
jgi:hypothetical protein